MTVDLALKDHIHDKVNKAYSMLGVIRRNFKHVDKYTFVVIYKSMVRSQLEYANSVWNPHHVGLIETLEKVQKRATKMVYACKGMVYSDRLRYLKLPTLVYRRHRGNMIEVYKILHGLYDPEAGLVLERNEQGKTRGHSLKLLTKRSRHDIRKFSFSVRIVNLWNSLEEQIVNAGTLNSFKNGLDRFWANQDILYEWKAKLTGAGIRSLDI